RHSRCLRLSSSFTLFFYFMSRPPPRFTLFPYTTLFRSIRQAVAGMLWSKQHYFFDLEAWLGGHGASPLEDTRLANLRNIQWAGRSEEHTSELQSLTNLVCRLLLEKKNSALDTITHTPPH